MAYIYGIPYPITTDFLIRILTDDNSAVSLDAADALTAHRGDPRGQIRELEEISYDYVKLRTESVYNGWLGNYWFKIAEAWNQVDWPEVVSRVSAALDVGERAETAA